MIETLIHSCPKQVKKKCSCFVIAGLSPDLTISLRQDHDMQRSSEQMDDVDGMPGDVAGLPGKRDAAEMNLDDAADLQTKKLRRQLTQESDLKVRSLPCQCGLS